MNMKQTHSDAFREQALRKVFARGDRPVRAVADELGVNMGTLKQWMKTTRRQDRLSGVDPTGAQTAAGRLELLMASAGLDPERLQAWCRERGVYAHQLTTWKDQFVGGLSVDALKPLRQERDALKLERDGLARQLVRKDAALAEAAALLVLSKKFQALLAGGVE
jgi:transposase-like protein